MTSRLHKYIYVDQKFYSLFQINSVRLVFGHNSDIKASKIKTQKTLDRKLAANDYWNKNKKNLHINRETDKLTDVQNMHKVDKILYRQTNKKHITILGFSFWFIETRKEREMSKGKTKRNEI